MTNPVALQVASTQSTTASYADMVNARYRNEASSFFSIKQRIENRISNLPEHQRNAVRGKLLAAAQQWKRDFPTRTKWSDLELCSAIPMTMDIIYIDDTTQRELLVDWVDKIVRLWRDCQAMPIQVYPISREAMEKMPDWDGKSQLYAAWEGQHTAVSMYVIACWAMGLDPKDIEVPVVIYKSSERGEIRKTFMGKNSPEGNALLSEYELFRQMVLGVRLDGANDRRWLEAEEKQQYLEKAGLFVTAENAVDRSEAGAISRMKEIKAYSPSVISDFCRYAVAVQKIDARPIDTMEIALMCHWFNMARMSAIIYTDDEINSLAHHLLSLFDANFKTYKDSTANGPFWTQAKQAYEVWWNDYYGGSSDMPDKMVFKMLESTGIPFLHSQLRCTWTGGRIPKLNITTPFRPAVQDLFSGV